MATCEPSLQVEQKRAALMQILDSRTFSRCDQLKHFLTYICEMEFAGRGSDINEYAIGIEALGRPKEYSTQDDSTVRSRAYSLRQKLHEYYENERPDAPFRIELPKGSYLPHFVEAPVVGVLPVQPRPASGRRRWRELAAAFLGGALLASLVWSFWSRTVPSSASGGVDPILREAWGPLARPDAQVAVCLDTPPHLHLRSFPGGQKPYHNPPLLDAPPEVAQFYRTSRVGIPGTPVYMYPTDNSLLLGDALAATVAIRTLTSLGASFEVMPEKLAGHPALKRRNIMRFGSPSDSREIALDLSRAAFSVRYDLSIPDEVITNKPPGTPNAIVFRPKRGADAYSFGLLTVMPGEDSTRQRIVIASGISSAGAHAAMQFFSSPSSLKDLRRRFEAEGYHGFPPAYQVVLKYVTAASVVVRFSYEAHTVLK
jgi:hypothetical protein